MFESYFLDIISSSQAAITTKTAADIASSMAVELLSPISSQIDPLRVGEMNRLMNIALAYGQRLKPIYESYRGSERYRLDRGGFHTSWIPCLLRLLYRQQLRGFMNKSTKSSF